MENIGVKFFYSLTGAEPAIQVKKPIFIISLGIYREGTVPILEN
jgi:hypothetical protein